MRDGVKRRRFIIAAGFVAAVVAGTLTASRLRAKSPAQSPAVPQWQVDAGGKMAFDVASVKQDPATPSGQNVHSNVPIDSGPSYSPTGGLFSATNWRLAVFIAFAYKLDPIQIDNLKPPLPEWARSERFDIEARAQGDPTKDQM